MSVKIEYGCRWEESVQTAIEKLGGGQEILRVDYESDYQGHLDIDILLNDGRVFSYVYYYGSCSGCDPWEDTQYEDVNLLSSHIIDEATIFSNIEMYKKWRENIPSMDERVKLQEMEDN